MDLVRTLGLEFWNWLLPILSVLVTLLATVHVLLNKEDTKAAIGWIGLIWLAPITGAFFYLLLGVNRVERKAQRFVRDEPVSMEAVAHAVTEEGLGEALGESGRHLVPLARLVGVATGDRLLRGNRVEPLFGGPATYAAMLGVISGAERSIALSSYIFNDDRTGQEFGDALERAARRGVTIRVLIDALGAQQGGRSIDRRLARMGIPVARFNPAFSLRWWRYANLRNHSKILVVDGRIGFTGGMNILNDYNTALEPRPWRAKTDTHFEIHGPVVSALMQEFAKNWSFSTGEHLRGEEWFPAIAEAGPVLARGIADGPDDPTDPLEHTILGAISCARRSVRLATPYFLPDEALSSALSVAAMRGVEVEILIPSANNQLLVQWAGVSKLEPIIEDGCRVLAVPPPFDHSKLLVVDEAWCLIGSANWDERSLRLNYEFVVECYHSALPARLLPYFEARRGVGRVITLEEIRRRPLAVKIRDSLARLLTPYL